LILAIRLVPYDQLDRAKWDRCVCGAANRLIYARSVYLDALAGQWDALVEDDYVSVMPLCHRRKYGIRYLYQPPFTAQLGVFSPHPSEKLVKEFLDKIPAAYRLWDISLNPRNSYETGYPFRLRRNFVLELNRPYQTLESGFREQTQRNIRKANGLGLTVVTQFEIQEVFDLYGRLPGKRRLISAHDLSRFAGLCQRWLPKEDVQVYGVRDEEGRLLSAAVFLIDAGRAYYLFPVNTEEAKKTGAAHLLLGRFISDHAHTDLLLDFEGSDVPGVAFFYTGFGAREELYPAIWINRLPWPFRWLKRSPS
jgi:hypothetical protein